MNNREIRQAAAMLLAEIHRFQRPVRLMEVCGTHTAAIFASGIRGLLPPTVELVSGPGCPVCVTPIHYIDLAVAYAKLPGVIVASFGDLLRVPGTCSSLARVKETGGNVQIVYSPLDAVKLAADQPSKKVVFLAVGFETTAPTTAAAVLAAAQSSLQNFTVLSAHKRVPPALNALLALPKTSLDGFLLPGHVSMVTGMTEYNFLPAEHQKPAVVTGFEPLDILQAIVLILRQIAAGEARLQNAYPAAVRPEGNPAARKLLTEMYKQCMERWRGLGAITDSGLRLCPQYRDFDAQCSLQVDPGESHEPEDCRCGPVLCGQIRPPDCPLFAEVCTPASPVGACMVSAEGACAAWYTYQRGGGTV